MKVINVKNETCQAKDPIKTLLTPEADLVIKLDGTEESFSPLTK